MKSFFFSMAKRQRLVIRSISTALTDASSKSGLIGCHVAISCLFEICLVSYMKSYMVPVKKSVTLKGLS